MNSISAPSVVITSDFSTSICNGTTESTNNNNNNNIYNNKDDDDDNGNDNDNNNNDNNNNDNNNNNNNNNNSIKVKQTCSKWSTSIKRSLQISLNFCSLSPY